MRSRQWPETHRCHPVRRWSRKWRPEAGQSQSRIPFIAPFNGLNQAAESHSHQKFLRCWDRHSGSLSSPKPLSGVPGEPRAHTGGRSGRRRAAKTRRKCLLQFSWNAEADLLSGSSPTGNNFAVISSCKCSPNHRTFKTIKYHHLTFGSFKPQPKSEASPACFSHLAKRSAWPKSYTDASNLC